MQCGSRDIIDRDAWHFVGERELGLHREARRELVEHARDVVARDREAVEPELDPLEEDAFLDVGVLIGVHDVATVAEDEVRDRRHEPRLVRAREQQRGSGAHRLNCSLKPQPHADWCVSSATAFVR